ncbi:type IV toxin-antitoxin system AbiEi family antitoxin domain-containing protein [bacterium]|nr:type IV toxin-antitoxin system AbiEi family antitoxin domain-containing protein [bacterium]
MMDTLTQIEPLLSQPFFSSAEARSLGIHPSALAYYCKTGALERVGRGLYREPSRELDVPIEWEDLVITALSVPDGVVCLSTALTFYNLTDEFAREFWIAVPRKKWPPKREHTRIVRMSNMELGKEAVELGEATVPFFDRERTIVDSFRYLSIETALTALKRYLQTDDDYTPDPKKLDQYAKELKTDLSPYVMALSI